MGNIVKELKTENQERPIGLLTFTPRFSWKLEGSHNGSGQSAYRIQVMDEENLMWDTGKRVGEQTIDVRYEGTSLKPLTRYQWKVTSWDESGEENSRKLVRDQQRRYKLDWIMGGTSARTNHIQ